MGSSKRTERITGSYIVDLRKKNIRDDLTEDSAADVLACPETKKEKNRAGIKKGVKVFIIVAIAAVYASALVFALYLLKDAYKPEGAKVMFASIGLLGVILGVLTITIMWMVARTRQTGRSERKLSALAREAEEENGLQQHEEHLEQVQTGIDVYASVHSTQHEQVLPAQDDVGGRVSTFAQVTQKQVTVPPISVSGGYICAGAEGGLDDAFSHAAPSSILLEHDPRQQKGSSVQNAGAVRAATMTTRESGLPTAMSAFARTGHTVPIEGKENSSYAEKIKVSADALGLPIEGLGSPNEGPNKKRVRFYDESSSHISKQDASSPVQGATIAGSIVSDESSSGEKTEFYRSRGATPKNRFVSREDKFVDHAHDDAYLHSGDRAGENYDRVTSSWGNLGYLTLRDGFSSVYRRKSVSDIPNPKENARIYLKVDRKNIKSNVYLEGRIASSIAEGRLSITCKKAENLFFLNLGTEKLEIKHLYVFTRGQEPHASELKSMQDSMHPEHALVQMLHFFPSGVEPSGMCFSQVSPDVDGECRVELCCNVSLSCSAHNLLSCALMSHPEIYVRNWKYDMVLQYVSYYFDRCEKSLRTITSEEDRENAMMYMGGIVNDVTDHEKEFHKLVDSGLLPEQYTSALVSLMARKGTATSRSPTGTQRSVLLMLYALFAQGEDMFYLPDREKINGLVQMFTRDSSFRIGITVRVLQYVYSTMRQDPSMEYFQIAERAPYLCTQLPGLVRAAYTLVSAVVSTVDVISSDILYPLYILNGFAEAVEGRCDTQQGLLYAKELIDHASSISSTDEEKAFAIRACTTDSIISRQCKRGGGDNTQKADLIMYMQQGSSNEKQYFHNRLLEYISTLQTEGLEALVVNAFAFELFDIMKRAHHCLPVFLSEDIKNSDNTKYINGVIRISGQHEFGFLSSVAKLKMQSSFVVPQRKFVSFIAADRFNAGKQEDMIPVEISNSGGFKSLLRSGIDRVFDLFMPAATGVMLKEHKDVSYSAGNNIQEECNRVPEHHVKLDTCGGSVSSSINDNESEIGIEPFAFNAQKISKRESDHSHSHIPAIVPEHADGEISSALVGTSSSHKRKDSSDSQVREKSGKRVKVNGTVLHSPEHEVMTSLSHSAGDARTHSKVAHKHNGILANGAVPGVSRQVQNITGNRLKGRKSSDISNRVKEKGLSRFTLFLNVDEDSVSGIFQKGNYAPSFHLSVERSGMHHALICRIGDRKVLVKHRAGKPVALLLCGDKRDAIPHSLVPYQNTLRCVFEAYIPEGVSVADGCSNIAVTSRGKGGIVLRYDAVEDITADSLMEYAVHLPNACRKKMWWRYEFLSCYLHYYVACSRVGSEKEKQRYDVQTYQHFFSRLLKEDSVLPKTCREMLKSSVAETQRSKKGNEGTSIGVVAMLYGFSCTSYAFHVSEYSDISAYQQFNMTLLRIFLTNAKFRHAVISSAILHASRASNMCDIRTLDCARRDIFPIFPRRIPYLSDSIHAVVGITKNWTCDKAKNSQYSVFPFNIIEAFAESPFIKSRDVTLSKEYCDLMGAAYSNAKSCPEAFFAFCLSASLQDSGQERRDQSNAFINGSVEGLRNTAHLNELVNACTEGSNGEITAQIDQYLSSGKVPASVIMSLMSYAVADHITRFYEVGSHDFCFIAGEEMHEEMFIGRFKEFVRSERALIDSGCFAGCMPSSLKNVKDIVPANYIDVSSLSSDPVSITFVQSAAALSKPLIDR